MSFTPEYLTYKTYKGCLDTFWTLLTNAPVSSILLADEVINFFKNYVELASPNCAYVALRDAYMHKMELIGGGLLSDVRTALERFDSSAELRLMGVLHGVEIEQRAQPKPVWACAIALCLLENKQSPRQQQSPKLCQIYIDILEKVLGQTRLRQKAEIVQNLENEFQAHLRTVEAITAVFDEMVNQTPWAFAIKFLSVGQQGQQGDLHRHFSALQTVFELKLAQYRINLMYAPNLEGIISGRDECPMGIFYSVGDRGSERTAIENAMLGLALALRVSRNRFYCGEPSAQENEIYRLLSQAMNVSDHPEASPSLYVLPPIVLPKRNFQA